MTGVYIPRHGETPLMPHRFTKLGMLTQKNPEGGETVAVVDFDPPRDPASVHAHKPAQPLLYVFPDGMPDRFGVDSHMHAIETKRCEVHQAFNAYKNVLPEDTGRKLLEKYAYSTEAANAQGWHGALPANPPKHSWNQIKDHLMGYPRQLDSDPAVRRRYRVLGRAKLWFRGLKKTFNRVEEASSKGARTLFTSFPGQLGIGVLVAAPVLSYMAYENRNASSHSA